MTSPTRETNLQLGRWCLFVLGYLFTEPLCPVPRRLPLEVWSWVIKLGNRPGDGSWDDTYWCIRQTLSSLSLTCWPLYHESKRQILACIWIELRSSHWHRHKKFRGAAATYSVDDLLGRHFLTDISEKDLIRSIFLCVQVRDACGEYPEGGRHIVKTLVDHLLGYRVANTD
jgi:hypothetical protein